MSKKLVAYFSASGTTARAAKQLAKAAEADLYEIAPETPYSAADLDWTDKNSRSTKEMNDPDFFPPIAGEVPNTEEYDVLFLGFPIWWYTAPSIIKTFLKGCQLSGKKIVLFATSGGSSLGSTAEKLKPFCPGADIKGGKMLNGALSEGSLRKWVDGLKLD